MDLQRPAIVIVEIVTHDEAEVVEAIRHLDCVYSVRRLDQDEQTTTRRVR